MEDVRHFFAIICSQHQSWTPGGQTLPFCQRCTGLYVGATLAAVLYAVCRPHPSSLSLWSHGLLLLVMVPFGYHLVPQNGLIRSLTGQLFAVGLICYLSLLPGERWQRTKLDTKRASRAYLPGVLLSLLLVQLAVRADSPPIATLLAWLGVAGMIVLGGLAIVNVVLLLGGMLRAGYK
jgi:uncharacterized membrane protein